VGEGKAAEPPMRGWGPRAARRPARRLGPRRDLRLNRRARRGPM